MKKKEKGEENINIKSDRNNNLSSFKNHHRVKYWKK